MKNTYSIAERNAIVEEHLYIIDRVMRKNRELIEAARMERDDVYQQLAERMIRAVDNYDPEKGKLKSHLYAQAKYELLNCKHPRRLYGISAVPSDYGWNNVVHIEDIRKGTRDADAMVAVA